MKRKSKVSTFDIELLDTLPNPSRVIRRGEARGRYPLAALRQFAKRLPPGINLKEMRTPTLSRFVFLHSRRKE